MSNATPSSSAAAHRKRRWFQFSLRTLLVLVLMVSCGMGWLGLKVRQGRRQKAAVDAILKSRGLVTYGYEFDSDEHPIPNAALPGAKWLQSLLGIDFFRRVRSVDYCANHVVVGTDFECLKDLPGLKSLGVLGPQRIPDTAFKPLAELTQLEHLYVQDSELTDAGMEHFRTLTNLRTLYLVGAPIGDSGLESLKAMTQLEELHLEYTQVTDAGLERIAGLTQLRWLDLSYTQVTDAGLKNLEPLVRLADLRLIGTQATGKGLVHLKELRQLDYLEVDASDDAVPYLMALTQLEYLRFGKQPSDAGLQKIYEALPKCTFNPD